MFSKLFGFLGKRPVLIRGAGKLAEGQSKRIEIGDALADGLELVLCRVGGRLCAIDRRCPHEGGLITDGPLQEGRYAVCPLHNYKFDPKSGRAIGVACPSAKTYRVRETAGGDAEVWL